MGYFLLHNSAFLLILVGLNGLHVFATASTKVFQIYKIDNGCRGENFPFLLANISIKLENNTFLIRFDITLDEDISEDFKTTFSLTRCLDKAVPDTCESYRKITFPHFCQFTRLPGPWSLFMNSLVPPIACPPKKGNYVMSKSIARDLTQMKRLKLGDGYYIKNAVRIYGIESNKLISCIDIEGQT